MEVTLEILTFGGELDGQALESRAEGHCLVLGDTDSLLEGDTGEGRRSFQVIGFAPKPYSKAEIRCSGATLGAAGSLGAATSGTDFQKIGSIPSVRTS